MGFFDFQTLITPQGDEIEMCEYEWHRYGGTTGIAIPVDCEPAVPLEKIAEWTAAARAAIPEFYVEDEARRTLRALDEEAKPENFHDYFSRDLDELLPLRAQFSGFPDNQYCRRMLPMVDRAIEYARMLNFAESLSLKERKALNLPLSHKKREQEAWKAHCRMLPEYAAYLAQQGVTGVAGSTTAESTDSRSRYVLSTRRNGFFYYQAIVTPKGDKIEIFKYEYHSYGGTTCIVIPVDCKPAVPPEKIAEWIAVARAAIPRYDADLAASTLFFALEKAKPENFHDQFSRNLGELLPLRAQFSAFPDNEYCSKVLPMVDSAIEYVQMLNFAESLSPKERKALNLPLTPKKREREAWKAHCRTLPEYAAYLAQQGAMVPETTPENS
jgi:hypothetical protein